MVHERELGHFWLWLERAEETKINCQHHWDLRKTEEIQKKHLLQ